MNANSAVYVRRATELWDRPCFIFLCRHPLAVIESMVDLLQSTELMSAGAYITSQTDAWYICEKMWVTTTMAMQEADKDKSISEVQKLHIKYENFVTSPKESTQQICKLLGLTWEMQMANPYTSKSVRTFQSHDGEIATTDPKLLQHERIDPRSAEKWRSVKPVALLHQAASRLAMHLGYDTALHCYSKGESSTMPLVLMHGFDGRCSVARPLAKALSSKTPFFALEGEYLHSADPEHVSCDRLEQYGLRLAARIASTPIHGLKSKLVPVQMAIMGYSWGCLLAHYVAGGAARLPTVSWVPACVVLVDPPPLSSALWRPPYHGVHNAVLETILSEVHAQAAAAGLSIKMPVVKDMPELHALKVALDYVDKVEALSPNAAGVAANVSHRDTFMIEYVARSHLRRMTVKEGQVLASCCQQNEVGSNILGQYPCALILSADRSWFVDDGSHAPNASVVTAVCTHIDDAVSIDELKRAAKILLMLDGGHIDVCSACMQGRNEPFVEMLRELLEYYA